MALLEWRPARPDDARGLQCFECTTPPKKAKLPPYGYSHPAEWEYRVQSYIRGLKPRVAPNERLWLGLDAEGVGAVSYFSMDNGPAEFFVKVAAVGCRHRGRGGGVADEMMRLTLDEMTALAIDAGVPGSLVTAHIDESNRPSQYMARRTGFQQVDVEWPYQVWQVYLEHPLSAFQEQQLF